MEIGRICIKIAGRDANLKCIVVDILDGNHVLIDGQTRRRKCNNRHLEPLDQVIKIKKNAAHSDIVAEFKKLNIELIESKPKKATERPVRMKKKKAPRVKQEVPLDAKIEASKAKPKVEKRPSPKEQAEKSEPTEDQGSVESTTDVSKAEDEQGSSEPKKQDISEKKEEDSKSKSEVSEPKPKKKTEKKD